MLLLYQVSPLPFLNLKDLRCQLKSKEMELVVKERFKQQWSSVRLICTYSTQAESVSSVFLGIHTHTLNQDVVQVWWNFPTFFIHKQNCTKGYFLHQRNFWFPTATHLLFKKGGFPDWHLRACVQWLFFFVFSCHLALAVSLLLLVIRPGHQNADCEGEWLFFEGPLSNEKQQKFNASLYSWETSNIRASGVLAPKAAGRRHQHSALGVKRTWWGGREEVQGGRGARVSSTWVALLVGGPHG